MRRITLSSPASLTPPPLTTISPSTFTFSSTTSPSSTPAVTYRFPATTVSFRVTPEDVIVTLPQTSPNVVVPGLLTGVPTAFRRITAASPRVMLFCGRKVPSG